MKLTTMLRTTAERKPSTEALVSGDQRWTYSELLEDSCKAATVLADHGVTERDSVAAMTFNEAEFILLAFGTWMLGATFVPVNHKLAPAEVNYTINHSGAKWGIASPELVETARAGAPEITWLDTDHESGEGFRQLIAAAEPWEEAGVDDETVALILYTSGTTSSPKGCVHTHQSLYRLFTLLALNLGMTSRDRTLISMPIWHSAPLNVCMMPTLLMGGTVVLDREFHPIDSLTKIEQEQITMFFGPTVAYLAPLHACQKVGIEFSDFDFSSMRSWLFGGSPIDAAGTRRIVENYRPGEHFQVYGMSETGPSGSLLGPEEQLEKPGSIGRCGMIGVEMKVVRADGGTAANGETGEIWFRSETMMRGYLNNPEETTAALEGGWYRTGDVARVDEDGYYFVVDRLKDTIIVGGENVHSLEVEEAVSQYPGVVDVAVVAHDDPHWGQQVVAVVTTTDGSAVGLEDLQEHLRPRLARYKFPRRVVMKDALPRNPSGKLLKHKLRDELVT